MTIKDEIYPQVNADVRLCDDGTLWIKTDKLDKVWRVIVEHGTSCKQFYQDVQPEQPTGKWIKVTNTLYRCNRCEAVQFKGHFCKDCGAKMEQGNND